MWSRFGVNVNQYIRNVKRYYGRPEHSKPGVGNLLHLKSQISLFITIRIAAGAAELPSGPKTSVISKMIFKKRSLFTSKRSHNWGFKVPRVTLEPQVPLL